ncbi:MAG: transglutaminase domain-containing protein [Bacteroidales bacterium]|nr:transglutaminase domain-containing protein [Bacteroidales bacterium]
MRKKYLLSKAWLLLLSVLLLCVVSCKKNHFITDKTYRQQVEQDFKKRTEMVSDSALRKALFGGMDTLAQNEQEALKFLYAYMPYSDMADYDRDFFLKQVRAAFKAREDFAWGEMVPEDIFRHFVLVYRVNNEDLDTARLYMQEQLKERLKGLSMYDAALEVNHWCHEHVAYRAADARTSAPLATMRTSLGRCGEESTFTVTAMRAVGIPARQCYTPRWAHCDDNHAWVEVWVDGRWYFLGACEPDAELDMGWFAVPSTRTMMVHSFVFGPYAGQEEVNYATALYSKVNMLPNYAPFKKARVTVLDAQGKPVKDAKVNFKLYNYSEYYPLAVVNTDNEGVASLTTGLGDLLIWATDGKHYAYAPIDMRKQDTMTLWLTRTEGTDYSEEYHMTPPVAGEAKVTPSPEKKATNDLRIAQEDSMRADYVASFPSEKNYLTYLKPNQNITDAQAWELIRTAEGNYQAVADFLNKHTEKVPGLFLYDYLKSYSDKDLRDVPTSIFEAQLTQYDRNANYTKEVYQKGILPARISNELVRDWRLMGAKYPDLPRTPEALRQWTLKNIAVDDTGNYYNCPISPMGTMRLRHSDRHSRDIFYVAACRSVGIPAYLDNATGNIFVYENKGWRTVTFEAAEKPQPTVTLTLTDKGNEPKEPVYWTHFTLARYKDGDFVTYDFEDDPRMAHFPATVQLEPGYYLLSTGNRYPEGDVLSRMEYFRVSDGQKLTKEISIRPLVPKSAAKVFGTLSPSLDVVQGMATVADYAGEKGMIMLFLGDYREPSKHLVKELQEQRHRTALVKWGGMIYLVAPESAEAISWNLPNADCVLGTANVKDPLETALIKALNLKFKDDYPLVAVVNRQGEILFHNEGYRIGLAEQLLNVVGK